jgi:hypothetical protein
VRRFSGVLLASALLVLTGCGGSADPSSAAKPKASKSATPSADDKSAGGASTAKPFEITETTYSTIDDATDTVYIEWTAVIRNPNEDAYGLFPVIRITARDAAGKVIATDDQTLGEFPPGTSLAFSGQLDSKEKPAKVEFTYAKVEWHDTKTRAADYKEFSAKQVSFRKGDFGDLTVTGEITNPFAADLDSMAVTALLRDAAGKLVGGGTDFADSLPASGSLPFELDANFKGKAKVKSVEIMAMPWTTMDSIAWNHLALGEPLEE